MGYHPEACFWLRDKDFVIKAKRETGWEDVGGEEEQEKRDTAHIGIKEKTEPCFVMCSLSLFTIIKLNLLAHKGVLLALFQGMILKGLFSLVASVYA